MATQTPDIERELSRDEKSGTMHAENIGGLSENDADFVKNFPEDRKKAVIRKVDVSCPMAKDSSDVILTWTDATHPYACTSLSYRVLRQDKHWYVCN